MKLLTIVIVNYNLTSSIRELIQSIYKNPNVSNYNITVVDNNSVDRGIENLVSEFPEVKFEFLNTNYGFGHANNYAIKKNKAEYYFILNPDTLIIDNSINELINFLETNTDYGIVSPITLDENGSIDYNYREFPNLFEEIMNLFGLQQLSFKVRRFLENKLSSNNIVEPDFVYGAAMMIRKQVFDKIGFFDENFFLFAEETDLCYRLKKETNYKIGILKNLKIIHAGGKAISQDKSLRIRYLLQSKLIFISKHYSSIKKYVLRFIIAVSLLERILFYSFSKKNKKYLDVYTDLLKQYISGKPKTNKKLDDE